MYGVYLVEAPGLHYFFKHKILITSLLSFVYLFYTTFTLHAFYILQITSSVIFYSRRHDEIWL